jgi:hypothetical protein
MLSYLDSAKRQFLMYKQLGEKAMAQLEEKYLFWQANDDSNSIVMVIKHMRGNMLSRWTDFLTTDGEKEWRNRDTEFENEIKDTATLMQQWEEGWQCLFISLNSITDNDLDKTIYIRNEAHSVLEAINRQIAHYAYHVGQIVYIAKLMKSNDWQSLSIPRNQSKIYNAVKFGKK